MIRYVAQPNSYGCLVACCAMLLGKTYEEMDAELPAHAGQAIHEVIADALLDQHGFAVARRYRYDPVVKQERVEWPPRPFAPAHWALVHATAGAHAVVLLGDGRVLDPWAPDRTSLLHPAYASVDHVTGVWRRP